MYCNKNTIIRRHLLMKKTEKGVTLLSLVITIIVMIILAGVVVNVSLTDSPTVESIKKMENSYYNQQTDTEEEVNDMVNGWEDIIL
jgi:type II secretory pathway pseudopilin PulG